MLYTALLPVVGYPVNAVHSSPASRRSACTCCTQLSGLLTASLCMLYTALSPLGGQPVNAVHSFLHLGGQLVHAVHSSPGSRGSADKCCTQLSGLLAASLYMLYTALSPLGGEPVNAVHSSPTSRWSAGKCCTQLSASRR
jgi:hypothetical protein